MTGAGFADDVSQTARGVSHPGPLDFDALKKGGSAPDETQYTIITVQNK
jgi:hypothetical protein